MATRTLSYSEIQTAMSCFARWDFAYGGRLAGSTLKPREIARVLSDGRAWGAAVAAFHANSDRLFPIMEAQSALTVQIEADAREQRERGIAVEVDDLLQMELRLSAMLDHYAHTSDPLPGTLVRLEDPIDVPLPSRTGLSSSRRYRFSGYLDGFVEDGGEWIVEYKLRGQLTPAWLIELGQQVKWYAWARRQVTGHEIVGVLVDERLNAAPHGAMVTPKTHKVAHRKDQLTTVDSYLTACLEYGEDPHDDVVEALQARVWQHRVPIVFRPGELDEGGRDLVSAAKLIRDLDSGELWPVRNSQRQLCQGCRFRRVCANPDDDLFVETLFERTVPKRLREPRELQELQAAA